MNRKKKEKFCMIKDDLLLYDNKSQLFLNCSVCKKAGHLPIKCPEINLIIYKQYLIEKHNFSMIQTKR